MPKRKAFQTPSNDKKSKTKVENAPKEERSAVRKTGKEKLPAKEAKVTKKGKSMVESKEGLKSESKKGRGRPKKKEATDDAEVPDLDNQKDSEEQESPKEVVDEKVAVEKNPVKPIPEKNLGFHVSPSRGLNEIIPEILHEGARAFGLFLRDPQQLKSKPLSDEEAEIFVKAYTDAGFSPDVILPMGINLMNLAAPDEKLLAESREVFIDDLKRCERLGLKLYAFHPGSTCGEISVEEAIERVATGINEGHKVTKDVVILLVNMCCEGHTIGGKFNELKAIIDRVEDKSRIGICFDTCQAHSAGYDMHTRETFLHTMDIFHELIGLKYLKAAHLSDTKGYCRNRENLPENIGHGQIGWRGLRGLMNDRRFNKIPLILVTPKTEYSLEIGMLYGMVSEKYQKDRFFQRTEGGNAESFNSGWLKLPSGQ